MRHLRAILSLLVSLLLVVNVPAQTGERDPSTNTSSNEIVTARSQYVVTESTSRDANSGTDDVEMLAQLSRRGPVLRHPPRARYSGPGYPRMAGPIDGHHAAIGALIGFGVGAALGVKVNTDNHARARLAAPVVFGAFGALIGAVAGGSVRPLHSRNGHRPTWPDEDQVASKSAARTIESAARPPVPPHTPVAAADNRPDRSGAP